MAGRGTEQYLAVQKNQDILERALMGAGAEKSLLTQYKSHGWVDQLANMKADELITNALTKIEIKVENYEVFIEMLRKVKVIKDAVDMIIEQCPLKSAKDQTFATPLFTNQAQLQESMMEHLYPFPCEYCGQRFADYSDLLGHQELQCPSAPPTCDHAGCDVGSCNQKDTGGAEPLQVFGGGSTGIIGSDSPDQAVAAQATPPPQTSLPFSPTSPRTGKLSIDRDVFQAKGCLKHLEKHELKDLFQELGLSHSTVQNNYSGSTRAEYSEGLIRDWIRGEDGVLTSEDYSGGATWENLRKALNELNHHGVANDI